MTEQLGWIYAKTKAKLKKQVEKIKEEGWFPCGEPKKGKFAFDSRGEPADPGSDLECTPGWMVVIKHRPPGIQ